MAMAVLDDTRREVNATAKFVRGAPRKAQLVVAEIRGRSVAEARTVLAFMPRAAARDVEKVLASAVANAEANHGLSGDDLFVSAAYVGSGPTLKRWRARARGRVGRIKKRTCHITIRVAPVEGVRAAPAPVAEPQSAPRRARRPKADAVPAAAPPADVGAAPAAPPADVGEEEGPPAPKPRRAPRKTAAAAAPATDAEAEQAAPAPRPARARKAAPKTDDAPPAEKPKRAPRKRAAKPDGEEK